MEELLRNPLKARFARGRLTPHDHADRPAPPQLYRDSLRLANYLAHKQQIPSAALREQARCALRGARNAKLTRRSAPQVRASFRRNASETNEAKIVELRAACAPAHVLRAAAALTRAASHGPRGVALFAASTTS